MRLGLFYQLFFTEKLCGRPLRDAGGGGHHRNDGWACRDHSFYLLRCGAADQRRSGASSTPLCTLAPPRPPTASRLSRKGRAGARPFFFGARSASSVFCWRFFRIENIPPSSKRTKTRGTTFFPTNMGSHKVTAWLPSLLTKFSKEALKLPSGSPINKVFQPRTLISDYL